jgi:predicted 5'-methylthioadenosine/S-adenosylhomocysteine nucleosidase
VLLVVAATERELALVSGVETLCCGVGPVEAAVRTARALAERDVEALLHIGIAGARTIAAPALVLGSEAVYCDVIDAGSTFPRVERAEPDAELLAAARAVLPEAHVASISTCGRIGGGSDVEAMEGFGVLRAAQLAGVAAVELRAISNAVNEADRSKWRFDDAFALLAEAVNTLVPVLRHA